VEVGIRIWTPFGAPVVRDRAKSELEPAALTMDHGGGLVRLLMDPSRSIRSRPTIPQSRILPFLAAFVLVFSACASSGGPETESAPRTAKVAVLGGVSDLRGRFNEDSGKVRLILLISPT
jgi:hypothetical protein